MCTTFGAFQMYDMCRFFSDLHAGAQKSSIFGLTNLCKLLIRRKLEAELKYG